MIYERINDWTARTDAQPVPPDRDRCRWVGGGERCPRRIRATKSRAWFCDEHKPLAKEASRRRRYERWKRSHGGALYRTFAAASAARMAARRAAREPRIVALDAANAARKRAERAWRAA